MNRSRKRFSPLGDFFPLKMYQSSLNKRQQNLKAKQNPIKNVEGEFFRLNTIISDQKSEIFALKCQVNEKNLIPNPSHTSYASALKFPPPQKFTPLIKQCRPLMSLSFPTLSKSLSPPTTRYSLPTSPYSRPTTRYSTPTPRYSPPTTRYTPPTTHYTPRYFLLNPRYSPPTGSGSGTARYSPTTPRYSPPSPREHKKIWVINS